MGMTDEELVYALRNNVGVSDYSRKAAALAADRIEQLVATNEQLVKERDDAENKLAKAVEALGEISSYDKGPSAGLAYTARILLNELEKTE